MSTLGGKGYQLYRLMQFFNVPPFFVISFDSSDEISIPMNQDSILTQCNNQNLEIVAVRSSANVEDSEQNSFAGMFTTVLNVPISEVISAIAKVLDITRNERLFQYCMTHGIDINRIKMNVIIQKMVRSRVSGVCFTRTQNQADQLIIEACYGLGEALVSGKLTPDSYIVDRKTLNLKSTSIAYQKIELQVAGKNLEPPKYIEIPFHKRSAKKLTFGEIKEVVEKSLLIEEHLGFIAADIEWAFEGKKLYMLQARPYTGFSQIV